MFISMREEDKVHVFYSLSGEGDYEVSLGYRMMGDAAFPSCPNPPQERLGPA